MWLCEHELIFFIYKFIHYSRNEHTAGAKAWDHIKTFAFGFNFDFVWSALHFAEKRKKKKVVENSKHQSESLTPILIGLERVISFKYSEI